MKHKLNTLTVIITQFVLVAIFKVIGRVVIRRKANLQLQFNENYKYVVYSNHTWIFDPFLICSHLTTKIQHKFFPFRFFVMNRFFDGRNIALRPFLSILGCFPAKWHSKLKYGIATAEDFLIKGSTIMIFPEGRISKVGSRLPAKRGIEILARSPRVLLIPVRVKFQRNKIIHSYSITVGEPFSGKNMTAEQIMDVVYSLKFR